MNELLAAAPEATWSDIAPYLDAALGELDETDRDAVLLRYFEKKSAREMASQLGISDDAAQKRVSRAVERLREFFAKRGVTVGASGLAVVISANAVQAAPVGLALTISTAVVLTGTTLATTATIVATKAITMTALQKTIVAATIAVLAGAGIYEARQASQLRGQVQDLQQQQANQIQQLQAERDDATNQLAGLAAELANAKRSNSELLKLRGEVGLLRKQAAATSNAPQASVQKPTAPDPSQDGNLESPLVTRDQYEFSGFAQPEATVKSMFWAMSQADLDTCLAIGTPALQEQTRKQWEGHTEEEIKVGILNDNDNRRVTGYRIISQVPVSDNEVVLSIFQEGRNREKKMRLERIDGEWKYAGPPGQ